MLFKKTPYLATINLQPSVRDEFAAGKAVDHLRHADVMSAL